MKRLLVIISAAAITLLLAGLLILRIWMGQSVKENIGFAMELHSGAPEDALIAVLLDDMVPMVDRTHNAVWTLGQLKSEKALPILKGLYMDDAEGETCYGKHDSMLCQYEIHKSIAAIEKFTLFSYESLKTTSPAQD